MCGIAGYLGPTPPERRRVETCLDRMGRRGPDARGVYSHAFAPDRHVLLLHSRLSIIDLDPRANQPFFEGSVRLAFNGEVYNYQEMRGLPALRGRAWRTESDTEVLAAAFATMGRRCLEHAEGMWAFALYDEADGSLTLCRDRFGEKPLYLYSDAGGLYFGSEAKFVFALLGRIPPVNENHLARYLVNGYKALYKGRETFFSGLRELPAASTLTVAATGETTAETYFTPRFRPREDMSYAEAVAGARKALIESVRLRLRADVPIAFCMSGGVDSNALIAIAKRVFGYDVHGFTIVNSDARYEEMDLVRQAVAELGIRHTAIPIRNRGFLQGLDTLVRVHDAPVYTITYYAHWLLMESVAAHGYRIAVSGTAADELFSGYYDHHALYLHAVRHDPELYAASLDNWRRHIGPIVRNPILQDPEVFLKHPDERRHIFLDAEVYAGCLRRPWREAFAEERYTDDLMRNRMLNELFHEATPVILHEDDLNAMYYSIENRSPFLDRGLLDFCLSVPTRHLVRDGAAKAVLRDAVRGIAPDAVVDNRRKVGFNAPILDFLNTADPEVTAAVLADGPIFDLVDRNKVAALLEHDTLTNSQSKFLFNFLNARLFLEAFS